MKKKLFATLMLTGIILSASCTRDEVDDPTLQLSENGTITLPKAASEKTVTISTNQTEWAAITNVDWIELTQLGTILTIKALENTSLDMRKAEVAVMAGGLVRKLALEQAESELTIVTFPDKLEVNQWGGSFQFDVNANKKDWLVTSDAEWLVVTPKQHKGEVAVEIPENTSREGREAKLTLYAGKTSKEFVVTQQGASYFILPYLGINEGIRNVSAYEEARKSFLKMRPDGFFNTMAWDFETYNTGFDLIRYNIPDGKLKQMITFIADKDFAKKELDGFKEFLLGEGFEKDEFEDKIYNNKEKQVKAQINIEALDPHVVYSHLPVQAQAYKTWDDFPWGFLAFKQGMDGMIKYEAENGGTYNNEVSDFSNPEHELHYYDVDKDDPRARLYFINSSINNRIEEAGQIYNNINLVFFENEEEYYFTKEFTALYHKAGLNYLGFASTWHLFNHPESGRLISIRIAKYANIGLTPVVDIRVSPSVNSEESRANVPPYLFRNPDFEGTYKKKVLPASLKDRIGK